jgi:hypothetical protein
MILDMFGLPSDPDLYSQDWPDSLPASVCYGSFAELDEYDIVIPSWNSAPRQDVIRAGCTVATIDTTECDQVFLRAFVELPTEAAARARFAEAYATACEQASAVFAQLPEEEQRGALVPDGVGEWIRDDEWLCEEYEWDPEYR